MRVIALGSVKGSPGVTTTMLALASVWPAQRPVALIEADPDGGDLAARWGLPAEPGLTSLAAAGRHPHAPLDGGPHLQQFPRGLQVLVGPPDAGQAVRALEIVGDRLAGGLAEIDDRDVLVDCGRLHPGSTADVFLPHADVVVMVARPSLDQLQHLAARLPQLPVRGVQPVLLLIGDRPYAAEEVARTLKIPVIATLPADPAAAATLNGRGGSGDRLQRSALIRSARDLAERLAAALTLHSQGGRESPVSSRGAPAAGSVAREPFVSHVGHGEPSGWARALLGRNSPSATSRTER